MDRQRPWGSRMRLIIAALAIVLIASGCASQKANVDHNAQVVHAQGTQGPEQVTIIRDTWGVPHIYATDAEGALYGLAYAQMEDQAVPILTQMQVATGHSAAAFGPQCLPSCLTQDEATDLFQVQQTAQQKFATLPTDQQQRFAAFAAGMNAYISTHRASLPSWVTTVTPQDVVAYVQWRWIMAQAYGAASKAGVGQIGSSSASGVAQSPARWLASQPALAPAASNMAALAPSRTATGGALFYGDPHLPYTGIHEWYEAQLVYGNTSVAGAMPRGDPGIAIGTNGYLAWSETQNTVDESDVYQEQLNPANPNQYLFNGQYENMQLEPVTISVRMANGALKQVTEMLRYTRHGPVIRTSSGFAYAAKVSLFGQIGLAGEFWQMAEAKTLAQFKAALAELQFPQDNIMVADRAGNIFYVAGTRTGIRTPGYDYSKPVPGWIPQTDWQGIVPFSQLPQAENPLEGYLENANDAPWITAPEQINAAALPAYLRLGGDTPRSDRLKALLDPLENATVADMEQIGGDEDVLIAQQLKPIIAAAVAQAAPNAQFTESVQLLNAWNNVADVNSTAMPLFAAWLTAFQALHPSFSLWNAPPPDQVSRADGVKVIAALRTADNLLMQTYGQLAVPWGSVHKLARGSTVVPVGGGGTDEQTIYMNTCTSHKNGVCYVGQGSSYIMIVDLASGRLYTSRPLGESDNPASPHYADMTRLFAAKQYKEFWMARSDVLAHQQSSETLTFQPQ
jgi:acyl-homoserine-lactone acylase